MAAEELQANPSPRVAVATTRRGGAERVHLGLDGARPGFTEIRANATVSSPNASAAQLQELCQYVQDTSPVRDCLANPVPVRTTLEIV